ncbi:MAG: hypothetical protein B7X58_02835, partial [Marinobacter sp. 34-60-7]
MPAKPHTVLVLGGASLDTIVHLDSLPAPVPQTIWPKRAYRTLGSTGAGKALNLAALGHEVVLHTLLGDDPEAEAIRQQLAHPRIRLLVETTDAATEQHVNLMTEQGERISLFVQPPAAPESVDWRPVEAALANAQVLVANILSYVKPALPMLKATGKPLWTDLHDYDGQNPYHQPFIDAADVVFLSSDNLPDYRHTLWALIEQGKAFVVCTHGKDGATLLTRGEAMPEERVRISAIGATAEQHLRNARAAFDKAMDAEPALRRTLDQPVASAVAAVEAMLKLTDAQIVHAEVLGLSGADYFATMTRAIDTQFDLVGVAFKVLDATLSDRVAAEQRALWLVVLGGAVPGAFALWVIVLTARTTTRSIGQAVQVAQHVAAGDLTSKIEVTSTDEAGQLLAALKDMTGNLATIVGQVRTGTDTVATASSQIAAGNL